MLPKVRDWPYLPEGISPDERVLARGFYDRCVAYLDEQVGRLFDELSTRGLLENTVVVITSDHGELFGEHGFLQHKNSVYHDEIHVPLLVIDPRRVPAGLSIPAPVSLRDLAATVVDVAGVTGKSPFPGRSLARFWKPGTATEPASAEVVIADSVTKLGSHTHPTDESSLALYADDMVYIRDVRGREELYNIAEDPEEVHDLSGSASARDILERLRTTLQQQFDAKDAHQAPLH